MLGLGWANPGSGAGFGSGGGGDWPSIGNVWASDRGRIVPDGQIGPGKALVFSGELAAVAFCWEAEAAGITESVDPTEPDCKAAAIRR